MILSFSILMSKKGCEYTYPNFIFYFCLLWVLIILSELFFGHFSFQFMKKLNLINRVHATLCYLNCITVQLLSCRPKCMYENRTHWILSFCLDEKFPIPKVNWQTPQMLLVLLNASKFISVFIIWIKLYGLHRKHFLLKYWFWSLIDQSKHLN